MYSMADLLGSLSEQDVQDQLVDWNHYRWKATLSGAGADDILQRVEHAWAEHGGIPRSFVHSVGCQNPRALLVSAMAWGFGPNPLGPWRTREMLDADQHLQEIVQTAQEDAVDGF